jgi:hypothetical protein
MLEVKKYKPGRMKIMNKRRNSNFKEQALDRTLENSLLKSQRPVAGQAMQWMNEWIN